MSSSIILAPLGGNEVEMGALNAALAFARKLDGHICALFVRPNPERVIRSFPEGFYPGAYAAVLETIQQQWNERSRKEQNRFEKWRTTNGLHALYEPNRKMTPSAEWREIVGDEIDVLQDAGQLADIIVIAKPSEGTDGAFYERFETALLQTGRPVVLAPSHARSNLTLDRVLIAWNRKPQAARAVSAALPLLRQASEVAIFTKPEGRLTSDAAEILVDYLKWHGVHASILAPGNDAGSASEALTEAVKRFRPGLIVMGAYTHSRLRETIFGGVTQYVVNHATTPVFLTH